MVSCFSQALTLASVIDEDDVAADVPPAVLPYVQEVTGSKLGDAVKALAGIQGGRRPRAHEDADEEMPDSLTAAEVEKMKVPGLKAALEARGLSTDGLKQVLKARLLEALD